MMILIMMMIMMASEILCDLQFDMMILYVEKLRLYLSKYNIIHEVCGAMTLESSSVQYI